MVKTTAIAGEAVSWVNKQSPSWFALTGTCLTDFLW